MNTLSALVLPLIAVSPLGAAGHRRPVRVAASAASLAAFSGIWALAGVDAVVALAHLPIWISSVLVTFRIDRRPESDPVDPPVDIDALRQRRNELRESVSAAERDENRAMQIYGAAKALSESVSLEEMGPRLASAVQRLFDSYEFLLYAVEDGTPALLQRRGTWKREPPINMFPHVAVVVRPPAVAEIVPVLFVPIRSSGAGVEGGLFVKVAPEAEREAEFLRIAAELGPQLGMALNKALLFRQMELQSRTDGLTGTLRRQAFLERLDVEFKRAAVFKTEFHVLMIDVDHFKSINDTRGHSAGDAVLAGIGKILAESVYETDVVGRYGGEEFIVLLPRSEAAGALRKAEALRHRIEMEKISIGLGTIRVTVSVGVARYPNSGGTAEELIKAADKALYAAKKAGRNRVIGG